MLLSYTINILATDRYFDWLIGAAEGIGAGLPKILNPKPIISCNVPIILMFVNIQVSVQEKCLILKIEKMGLIGFIEWSLLTCWSLKIYIRHSTLLNSLSLLCWFVQLYYWPVFCSSLDSKVRPLLVDPFNHWYIFL